MVLKIKEIKWYRFACYVDVDEALREKVKKTNKQYMFCMLCGCRFIIVPEKVKKPKNNICCACYVDVDL